MKGAAEAEEEEEIWRAGVNTEWKRDEDGMTQSGLGYRNPKGGVVQRFSRLS